MADNDNSKPALIDFPCDFPIKVMGEMKEGFAETIIALIQTVLPAFNASNIAMRASSGGKYISLTCHVPVSSQVQLDAVYRLISAHPLVKFSL